MVASLSKVLGTKTHLSSVALWAAGGTRARKLRSWSSGVQLKFSETIAKPEIRGPKSERNPKTEFRIVRREVAFEVSDFGLRISFGFRISDFEFDWASLNGSLAIESSTL